MNVEEERDLKRLVIEVACLTEKIHNIRQEIVDHVRPDLAEIKNYNFIQNGNISKVIEKCNNNYTWIKAFKWILGVSFSIIGIILSKLFELW